MRSLLVSSFLFFTLSVAAEPLSSLPDHTSQNWWSDVQHSIRASEYEPKLHEGVPGAPNRAHGFRTRFEADRVVVVPRDGSSAWRWEIGLAGAPAAEPHANGNRVEYRRGDVVEWYVNSEKGLEQGFTIASPATKYVAAATLRLPLFIGGSLQAQARDGQRIDFFTSDGALAIRYDSLLVVDARGRTLRSRMELHGSQLHLLADVEGASWPIVVDPLTTSPAWSAESDQAGAQLGMSVASAGDVNGDGYSDVIVGAPFYDLGQIDGGCAFVYHGSPAGLSATASWTASSNQSGSDFGISVASAGDVNGDGYSDVIVGADLYSNGENMEGRAFVYHGSPSGLSLSPVWTAEADQEFATFGYAVASAGDVNGDGYHDVVVGAYTYQNGQAMEGRAYVYHGSSAGLSSSPHWMAESDQGTAYFGYSVARAGDVNGDGYDDLIVSAPHYSNGQAGEGRVSVYHGSAAGLAAAPEWTTESDQANAFFGVSVATAGDVNGDGYADVIVGAHAYSNPTGQEGGAFLYLGSSTGLSATAGWTAEGGQGGANFGVQVGSAGDVNGDGYADVIVGAHNFDAGQTDEGRAFLYYGSATGLPAIANWTAESDQASSYFAMTVATAGDVNGDGYSDVIVGAYSWDGGETNEGRAFVYHGSAAGLAATAAWTAEGDQTGASFGFPSRRPVT